MTLCILAYPNRPYIVDRKVAKERRLLTHDEPSVDGNACRFDASVGGAADAVSSKAIQRSDTPTLIRPRTLAASVDVTDARLNTPS